MFKIKGTVHGVGYVGEGKYKPSINGQETPQYGTWTGMMMRCYSEKYLKKNPTYNECIVDESWHNFQNFGAWYDENFYEVDGERMELDKDILIKGNKVYSHETCMFVPRSINLLFIKHKATRGEFPIGVNFDKEKKKYKVNCGVGNGKKKHIGYYGTPAEAFVAYKIFKEIYIKDKAETYRNVIPEILYNAMMNYTVDIND